MGILNIFNQGKQEKISLTTLTAQGMHNPPEDFIMANVRRELGSLVDDVLQPYLFSENHMDNVYEYSTRQIYQASMTMKDILLQAMLGREQIIHLIDVGNDWASMRLLFSGQPDDEGKIALGDLGLYAPIKSLTFEPICAAEEINLIKMCFAALWYSYQRQERTNKLDAKAIFKMHGFHALFTTPKNAEEEEIALANRRRIIDNVREILDGSGGIIDAQDDFGIVNGQKNAAEANRICIDAIYMEIARILKVPATRLLGRSPQGMNSTGQSDALNYDMTLSRIRSGWLDPFLQQMDITYKKVDRIDVDYLKKIVEMHNILGLQADEALIERIRLLGSQL